MAGCRSGRLERSLQTKPWRRGRSRRLWPSCGLPEDKITKNRVHIDLTPIDRVQGEEVERLVQLGATRLDIGQGERPWVVMADPEGNEFCVMPAIDSGLFATGPAGRPDTGQ
jgi:hypothetical protein